MPEPLSLKHIRRRLPAIKDWLSAAGAEVLEPTNEWEVLRFRAAGVTHVAYRNKANVMTIDQPTRTILNAFANGQAWTAGVAGTRRKHSADEKTLLARDGGDCFLCCKPLGDDITVEHLVSVAHGGGNHIANKVLAHRECNQAMGHLSVMQKIAMRERRANQAPAETTC